MFNQIKDNSNELQVRYAKLKEQKEAQIKASQDKQKASNELPKENTKKRGK